MGWPRIFGRTSHRVNDDIGASDRESGYDPDVLPVIWATFAICTVGGFVTLAAFWLDVQDRPDLTFRQRVGWSIGILLFPIVIPAYAFLGGPGWPKALRIAAFLPAIALALFAGFLFGVFD
jgi:hypothetical protein